MRFFDVFVEHFPGLIITLLIGGPARAGSSTPTSNRNAKNMISRMSSIRLSLAVAAGLALSAISSHAQNNVSVTGTLTYVQGTGDVFDYTLTLTNLGPESVSSLWLGWTVGVFDIANPSAASSALGWSPSFVGNSIQFGPGTPLAAGASTQFLFDSTSTPAQFKAGTAGPSVVYGVNATPFAIENTTPNSEEFTPTVATTSVSNPPSPPVILNQPKSQTVLTNVTVTFSVTASNATAYQWQSNLVAITGQTNDLLTLSNVVTSDSATYRVVVSNDTDSVISSNAVLLVLTNLPISTATREKLAVTINPAKSGSVVPNLNGESLLVNHSYTVR